MALDDREFHSGARKTRGHLGTGLASADDDRVVGSRDGSAVPAWRTSAANSHPFPDRAAFEYQAALNRSTRRAGVRGGG